MAAVSHIGAAALALLYFALKLAQVSFPLLLIFVPLLVGVVVLNVITGTRHRR